MRAAKLLTALILLCPALASAADAPVVYHQGFESDTAGWRIWAKNVEQPCQVNFVGPTTEKAFYGEKSLKLDLTFRDGNYCYWEGDRVKIPCTGDLKLSGYLYVEKLSPGLRVGLGRNVTLPPSGHTGCGTIETLAGPTPQWHRFELDLAPSGQQSARGLLGTTDVYCYVDRIAVMFTGSFKPGRQAVVYVDELKVTGHVPEDYEERLRDRVDRTHAERMAEVQDWQARVDRTAATIEQLRSKLTALPQPIRRHAERIAEATEAAGRQFASDAAQFLKRGRWMLRGEDQAWKERLSVVHSGADTLNQLLQSPGDHAGVPFVIYTRKPIRDDRMLPREVPVPASVGDTVRLTATPGEFEPATFALFACADLKNVVLEPGDLRSGSQTIPASAVDLRLVKAWYQNGISTIGFRKGGRMLVPELLLKDDGLIRVDDENQRNLLRQRDAEGGVKYVDISGSNPDDTPDVAPADADRLQPFDVPADTLKQVWITVRVPDQAPPGEYRGEIRIVSDGVARGTVHVQLDVLPFRLRPPLLEQSVYYGAKLGPNRDRHQVNSHYKNEEQLEAELRNMSEHGLTAPSTYQPYDANLEKVLRIRNRVGFRSGPLFTLGQSTGSTADPKALEGLKNSVMKWLQLARKYGHDEVYFYGIDEAKGDRLLSQRAAWTAVREAGGKTFVAGYLGSFESVGDLQDLLVFAGRPDPDEAKKYHSIGHKIFNYANPQCGCEQPERYRRNYGLLLWRSNFDGAMDFAYQWEFGHVWNDFDSPKYRDHVMAYPTVDGVIDTLQWEGYREGVDDTRYLATLLHIIDKSAPNRRGDADAARRWLGEVDIDGDLDAIRAEIIEWILKLQ